MNKLILREAKKPQRADGAKKTIEMNTTDWPTERALARTAILDWRKALPIQERRVRSRRIGELITPWLLAAKVDLAHGAAQPVLGAYWPIRGEPDLTGFFDQWILAGWTISLPLTPSVPGPLKFMRYVPGQVMEKDAMGVATPAQSTPLVPNRLLVPCVGYYAGRWRLGYGGGYYDRTLPELAATAIGVAYSETQMASFDAQAHDQPLAAIATDTGWVEG